MWMLGKVPFDYAANENTDNSANPQSLITKTCLFNSAHLKPHFYIVKLGLQWYTLLFLISAQKHRLWVLVWTASPVFSINMKKISDLFLSENFQFLEVKFSIYLNRRVFVMATLIWYYYPVAFRLCGHWTRRSFCVLTASVSLIKTLTIHLKASLIFRYPQNT